MHKNEIFHHYIVDEGQDSNDNEDKLEELMDYDRIIESQITSIYTVDAFCSQVSSEVYEVPPEDYLALEDSPEVSGVLQAKGHSMMPLIMPGDLVSYKLTPGRRGSLLTGNIYVVAYIEDGDENVVIKRIEDAEDPAFLRLVSLNPRYEPFEIERDSIVLMGLVRELTRPIHN